MCAGCISARTGVTIISNIVRSIMSNNVCGRHLCKDHTNIVRKVCVYAYNEEVVAAIRGFDISCMFGQCHGAVRASVIVSDFKQTRRAKEQRLLLLEETMETAPEDVKLESHEHPLRKTTTQELGGPYLGEFGCDVCGVFDSGWLYHSTGPDCYYDVCPKCAGVL